MHRVSMWLNLNGRQAVRRKLKKGLKMHFFVFSLVFHIFVFSCFILTSFSVVRQSYERFPRCWSHCAKRSFFLQFLLAAAKYYVLSIPASNNPIISLLFPQNGHFYWQFCKGVRDGSVESHSFELQTFCTIWFHSNLCV